MRLRAVIPMLIPALISVGCASQKTLDSQTATVNQQLNELRKSNAELSAAQKTLEARISKLEGSHSMVVSQLDQLGSSGAEFKRDMETLRQQSDSTQSAMSSLSDKVSAKDAELMRELDVLRTQSDTSRSGLAALAGKLETQGADLAQTRETAEDAIKIARDSRMVSGKVVDSLTLTSDMVLYSYEQPELTARGRSAMDGLIASVKPLMPHAFIEIIGFSDDLSLNSQNRQIALERAESVRRYLHEVGGIPLHRMSTISYGDLKPLASNTSMEGRIQNRRVVIQVLK